jgi:hypothetical protein
MHLTDNLTSFTCSVNYFSGSFQDRLGGIAALRDAKSGFRVALRVETSRDFSYIVNSC